jgi:RNA polymerase sigma-70 factor (ECF subfamily)
MADIKSEERTVKSAGKDVLQVVQQLPPAYRMVFNLYVMEEFKHREIAEKLSISIGTSKSNLARAKVKLQSMLLKQEKFKSHYA